MKVTVIPIVIGVARFSHQKTDKRTGGLGNKKTSGNHPNYSIIKISQNTEESPGDARRLDVSQTPVKSHHLTLSKEWNNNNYDNNENVESVTNCNKSAQYSHQKIDKRTGGFGNKRTNGDYPNYSIVEIVQNTEKCPGELRWLAIIQTLVEDHQLTLV